MCRIIVALVALVFVTYANIAAIVGFSTPHWLQAPTTQSGNATAIPDYGLCSVARPSLNLDGWIGYIKNCTGASKDAVTSNIDPNTVLNAGLGYGNLTELQLLDSFLAQGKLDNTTQTSIANLLTQCGTPPSTVINGTNGTSVDASSVLSSIQETLLQDDIFCTAFSWQNLPELQMACVGLLITALVLGLIAGAILFFATACCCCCNLQAGCLAPLATILAGLQFVALLAATLCFAAYTGWDSTPPVFSTLFDLTPPQNYTAQVNYTMGWTYIMVIVSVPVSFLATVLLAGFWKASRSSGGSGAHFGMGSASLPFLRGEYKTAYA